MNKSENKENIENNEIEIEHIHKIEDKVLQKIEINKNLYARVIASDDMYIDFRKFHNGMPTKNGIRFKLNILDKLNNLIKKN